MHALYFLVPTLIPHSAAGKYHMIENNVMSKVGVSEALCLHVLLCSRTAKILLTNGSGSVSNVPSLHWTVLSFEMHLFVHPCHSPFYYAWYFFHTHIPFSYINVTGLIKWRKFILLYSGWFVLLQQAPLWLLWVSKLAKSSKEHGWFWATVFCSLKPTLLILITSLFLSLKLYQKVLKNGCRSGESLSPMHIKNCQQW